MKYIIFKETKEGPEIPILFPATYKHSDIYDRFQTADSVLISAGFIKFDDVLIDDFKLFCYGEATTLYVRSRARIDIDLIKRSF